MTKHEFNRGQIAAFEKMLSFVEASITARRKWADSTEGRLALGPGSPTIPGMQDLMFMRDVIQNELAKMRHDDSQ